MDEMDYLVIGFYKRDANIFILLSLGMNFQLS